MKTFQLVLLVILLGSRVRTVKAVELESSIHRTIEADLFPAPRAESNNRCKRMEFCEWRWKERGFWQEKKKKNCQGEDPKRTLRKIARGGTSEPQKERTRVRTQGLLKNRAKEKDPSTFKGHHGERWRVQKKWKKKKYKKKEK